MRTCADAVSFRSLPNHAYLRLPDKSCVVAHLSLLCNIIRHPAAIGSQAEVECGVRCVAELLLQMAPQLVEFTVRARMARTPPCAGGGYAASPGSALALHHAPVLWCRYCVLQPWGPRPALP